jgi:hypothetical protein
MLLQDLFALFLLSYNAQLFLMTSSPTDAARQPQLVTRSTSVTRSPQFPPFPLHGFAKFYFSTPNLGADCPKNVVVKESNVLHNWRYVTYNATTSMFDFFEEDDSPIRYLASDFKYLKESNRFLLAGQNLDGTIQFIKSSPGKKFERLPDGHNCATAGFIREVNTILNSGMNRGGATRTTSKRNREIYESTTTISGEYTVLTSIAWPKMLPADVRLFQGYCMALSIFYLLPVFGMAQLQDCMLLHTQIWLSKTHFVYAVKASLLIQYVYHSPACRGYRFANVFDIEKYSRKQYEKYLNKKLEKDICKFLIEIKETKFVLGFDNDPHKISHYLAFDSSIQLCIDPTHVGAKKVSDFHGKNNYQNEIKLKTV